MAHIFDKQKDVWDLNLMKQSSGDFHFYRFHRSYWHSAFLEQHQGTLFLIINSIYQTD